MFRHTFRIFIVEISLTSLFLDDLPRPTAGTPPQPFVLGAAGGQEAELDGLNRSPLGNGLHVVIKELLNVLRDPVVLLNDLIQVRHVNIRVQQGQRS